MAKELTPEEMAAVKEASKFFAKYFGIPLAIVGFLVLVGIWMEPVPPPPIKEYIYVADTSNYHDTIPYTVTKPKKRTTRNVLEDIEKNTSQTRY